MARKFEILCIGFGGSISRPQLRELILEKMQEHDIVVNVTTDDTIALSVVCEDEWLTYKEDLKDLSLLVPDVIFVVESNEYIRGYVLNGRGSWKNDKEWEHFQFTNTPREPETRPEKPPDNDK